MITYYNSISYYIVILDCNRFFYEIIDIDCIIRSV